MKGIVFLMAVGDLARDNALALVQWALGWAHLDTVLKAEGHGCVFEGERELSQLAAPPPRLEMLLLGQTFWLSTRCGLGTIRAPIEEQCPDAPLWDYRQ